MNVQIHEGDEFSSLRAHARERTFERATLSLKLHDFDNIGFTKKGKKVGYEQFIASAWKGYVKGRPKRAPRRRPLGARGEGRRGGEGNDTDCGSW